MDKQSPRGFLGSFANAQKSGAPSPTRSDARQSAVSELAHHPSRGRRRRDWLTSGREPPARLDHGDWSRRRASASGTSFFTHYLPCSRNEISPSKPVKNRG